MMIFARDNAQTSRQKGKLCASHYLECICYCSRLELRALLFFFSCSFIISPCVVAVHLLFYFWIDWSNEMQTWMETNTHEGGWSISSSNRNRWRRNRKREKFAYQIWNSYQPLIADNNKNHRLNRKKNLKKNNNAAKKESFLPGFVLLGIARSYKKTHRERSKRKTKSHKRKRENWTDLYL